MYKRQELKDSDKLIEYLVKEGVVVSIGHTNATYDEAVVGIKAGATSGTHTYNAMTPLTPVSYTHLVSISGR